ncbi:RIP-like protein [Sitodiplosis mosellana]|uniref:RIP-like protein n=1 Tax=Sitodiplosis mosellana TaxID=263140 RepID=UPI002444AC97|nr:RIP-like protein [Sitodiplosis mosellana]
MEEQKTMELDIPKTKKHFDAMVHRINADKLRDMLREKCRIRVRESRSNKFDVSRTFLENEKQWLTDMLKGQLTELEMDLLLEDTMLQELIEEQYQWILEEYERSLHDIDLTGDTKSILVMCPICQICELHITNHLLHCKCGFQQAYSGTLEDFWKKVQSNVVAHEEKCLSKLLFFLDPNESALNLMCNNCDFLALIE